MTRSCMGQAKQSQLGRRYANPGGGGAPLDGRAQLKLTQGIRDSGDVEMSLLVRASRNLPIVLLTNEYKRILERRLQVVGGQSPPMILVCHLSGQSALGSPGEDANGTG